MHQYARLAAHNPVGFEALLPGTTGERNVYRVQARRHVLCHVGTKAEAALVSAPARPTCRWRTW